MTQQWKIEPHDNYMCDENQLPIQIVDGDGKVVACNTDYYPTAISAEHAAKIVLAVNEVAELRAASSFLIARLDDFERGSLGDEIEDACRDFDGHVSPAIERLRALVSS